MARSWAPSRFVRSRYSRNNRKFILPLTKDVGTGPSVNQISGWVAAILATKKLLSGCVPSAVWTVVVSIFHVEVELLKNGMSSAGLLESWSIHSDAALILICSLLCVSLVSAVVCSRTWSHTREHGDVVVSWLLLKTTTLKI